MPSPRAATDAVRFWAASVWARLRREPSFISWTPWLVAAMALVITGWLWEHEQRTTRSAQKAEFDVSVRRTASRIEARIASYEQMLRGVQGLVLTSGPLDADRFDGYVDTLLAGADFTGMQFFAYAARTPGSGDDDRPASINVVAPAVGVNLQVVGSDPYAEPLRREALRLARDSGGVRITRQLPDLFGARPAAMPGLLLVLPVYARGAAVDGVAQRRAALAGWVLGGLRLNDLMSSLYGENTPGLQLRIYDGVDVAPQHLMYESASAEAVAADGPALLQTLEFVGIAGSTWTLAISAGPRFARPASDAGPIIAGFGVGCSLLLALLVRQLVSGRQQANDMADARARELGVSEERFRRIVETADEGIWVTDDQARTTFVNPKLTRLLGYHRDEMVGRRLDEFAVVADTPAVDREPAGPAAPNGPRELRLRRRDGELLWASAATTPIVDASGQPAGTLTMVTDLTASKQAEAARTALEAQLRESQKMEAIGTLAGGIAHDFNNILAAILGNVALARDRLGAVDDGVQASLEQIRKAAERARSLVQQILAFSRKQPHRLVGLSLRTVVEDSLGLLRPVLPARAELDLALDDAPLRVLADATQLQQVVMNLVTNACHALQGGAGRIGVGLDAVLLDAAAAQSLGLATGQHAHLWVSDTGCGMDEATRSRVFEPFFTTKAVGQGTGLGLSVAHGIVATHCGAITVTSRPGAGSRFDLYLPLKDGPAEAAPASAGAVAERVPPSPSAGRHAVYVDDDPVMVAMVEALLCRCGYRVTCFENPREAIDAVSAHPDDFDIVVTDYNMPGLSGLDVAGELAGVRHDLPVVISSGYVSEDMKLAAARAGVRNVVQKEYTLERLPDVMRALLATPV